MIAAWYRRRPLVIAALLALLGIILSDHVAIEVGMLSLVLLFIGSILVYWLKPSVRWMWLLVPLWFALWHQVQLQQTRHHPWYEWLQKQSHPVYVEVEGVIEQPLRRNLPGMEAGESLFLVSRLNAFMSGVPEKGSAYVCLRTDELQLLPTGKYRITGWLKLPPPQDNPGQFNSRKYDLRLGLIGNLNASHIESLEASKWDWRTGLFALSEKCRAWISASLGKYLPAESNEHVVILAMALGATDTATSELQTPFRLSGTLHIFAVSGLHVVIIGAVFWFILKSLFLPRRYSVLILLLLLFGYVFVTGLSASAMRAAMMTSVILLATLIERRADTLNSLGAAALLLLLMDSNQVFSPGFQLSFGVVAAIVLMEPLFMRPFLFWTEPDAFMPRSLLSRWQVFGWTSRRWVAGLLTVSAAAWLGSLPFTLYHFHLATPVSLLANIVLVPLAFLVLALAVFTAVLSLFHVGFLAAWISVLNYWVAKWTLVSAQWFAGLPGGHFYLAGPEYFSRPPVQMTVLRLSGGDAANHLQVKGQHWLLDCGSARQFPFVVSPYLQYHGINKLEGVIISHEDAGHRSAAPLLLKTTPFTQLMSPWSKGTRAIRFSNEDKHFPPESIQQRQLYQGEIIHFSEQTSHSPVRAEVLYPPKELVTRVADDRTLICRFDVDGFRVLWCNDAGFMAEKYLLKHFPAEGLACDIIIRNQHSSDYSMLSEFLMAVQPKVVVSSNPAFPAEQMIKPALRETCHQLGIQLIDQNETGAVMIKFHGDHIEISPFRGNMESIFIERTESRND